MKQVYRVMDANLNRAREGLRVLEEVARFVLEDGGLSLRIKDLRHSLSAAAGELPGGSRGLVKYRDSANDVGSATWTPGEKHRQDIGHLVLANIKRVQEACRVLEEFGKLLNTELTGFKKVRFDAYTLEQELLDKLAAAESREKWPGAEGGSLSPG